MKKVLIVCGVLLGISVLILVLAIAGFVFLFIGEEQKPPQITTGEFPFVVEYEMNGETFIIEDTVVCEFDGYDLSALMVNKPRMWNSYLKSGETRKLLIIREDNKPSAIKEGRHNEWAELRVFYGIGDYYMGDPNADSFATAHPQFIYYETYTENGENRYNWGTKLSEEDLEKYFDIRIIRFEFSEPIKNEFR